MEETATRVPTAEGTTPPRSALEDTGPHPETAGPRLAVLKNRQFRLVLAERLLATSATGISTVALSFAVLGVTKSPDHPEGSASALSYVLAAQLAPMLVFTLVGGILADRFRPQRVMLAANLCGAVGGTVAAGAAAEYCMILWTVTLGRHIPQDKLARVYSFDALGSLSASPLGYLVAGPLANRFGTRAVQIGAVGLIVVPTAVAMCSREIRTLRSDSPVSSVD